MTIGGTGGATVGALGIWARRLLAGRLHSNLECMEYPEFMSISLFVCHFERKA